MATRSVGPSPWSAPASVVATLSLAVSGSTGNYPLDVDTASINFSCLSIETKDMASGNNTINLPVSTTDRKATAVIIVPPWNNTVAYTVRASGDTGIPENSNWPFVVKSFSTTAPPTSIEVNAAADISAMQFIWI